MELYTCGTQNNPAVLLMLPTGAPGPEDIFTALRGLEKGYFLLLPVFPGGDIGTEELSVLARRLDRDHAGRLWGAYGLRAGATALLSLLGAGTVSVRTLILEGGFATASAPPAAERIVCWKGSRDKPAAQAWKALKDQTAPVGSLTMKKLTKEQELLSLRPDMMVKQLQKALGKAVVAARTAIIMEPVDRVWAVSGPDPREEAMLDRTASLRREEDRRTVTLEGSSGLLKRWSHLTRLESAGLRGTVCTDQVVLDAGALNALARPAASLWLAQVQRRRKKALREGRHAV